MEQVLRPKDAICALSVALLLPSAGAQPVQAGTYHLIKVPNASETSVQGINNLNQIVGWYFDHKGNQHGFLLKNGKYTEIDFGQANETVANGINDNGVIVGFYQTPPPTTGPPHRWIDKRDEFQQIDYPGGNGTFPMEINSGGKWGRSAIAELWRFL